MLLAQPVEFERQLWSALGRGAEGIERHGQVAVAPDRVHKLSRGSHIAKKSGIDCPRWSRLPGGCRSRRSAQAFSKSEKLAPRLVYRRGIAPVSLVRLTYVSVVEDARYRVGAHA